MNIVYKILLNLYKEKSINIYNIIMKLFQKENKMKKIIIIALTTALFLGMAATVEGSDRKKPRRRQTRKHVIKKNHAKKYGIMNRRTSKINKTKRVQRHGIRRHENRFRREPNRDRNRTLRDPPLPPRLWSRFRTIARSATRGGIPLDFTTTTHPMGGW